MQNIESTIGLALEAAAAAGRFHRRARGGGCQTMEYAPMSLLVFACIQVPPPPRCRRRRRRPLGFFFFFFFCFLRRSGQPPSPHFQVPIDVGHRLGPRVHLSNLMRVIQKETSSLLPFFTLGIWLGPTRHLQDT